MVVHSRDETTQTTVINLRSPIIKYKGQDIPSGIRSRAAYRVGHRGRDLSFCSTKRVKNVVGDENKAVVMAQS